MGFYERVISRCSSKYNRILLIISALAYYIASVMFCINIVLNNSSDTNHFRGARSLQKTEEIHMIHKTLTTLVYARKLSVSTQIHDRRFVDVSLFQSHGNNSFENTLMITWLNKPWWFSLNKTNNYLERECPYRNCRMSESTNNLQNTEALIFNTQERLPNMSNTIFAQRPLNQVWVFFQMEPPTRNSMEWYKNQIYQNAMNWSWSYRLNSDIFRPIGTLAKRKAIGRRNYREMFKKKSKVAAWLVSHCSTQSLREKLVTSLIKEGVPIDIFGGCSKNRKREDTNYIRRKISQEYKFYLSFENSLCEDYITEKFFTYYGLDVVLIVRGGLNYSTFFDKSTFIDTSDFASVKELAKYILTLNNSEEAYVEYLRNKDKYIPGLTQEDTIQQSSCQLCVKLNNARTFRNVYHSIDYYLNNETCFQPNDYS